MASFLFQLILVASITTVSGQQALNYAQEATDGDGNPLILVSDSYTSTQLGEAILTILPGETDVQKSNYDWRSCQIKNTGAKRIAAVFIDVGSAIFSDMVFDPDGSGGDDVAKKLEHNWGTTETNVSAFKPSVLHFQTSQHRHAFGIAHLSGCLRVEMGARSFRR